MGLKKFGKPGHSYKKPTWRKYLTCVDKNWSSSGCKRKLEDPRFHPSAWTPLERDAVSAFNWLPKLLIPGQTGFSYLKIPQPDRRARTLAAYVVSNLLEKYATGVTFRLDTLTQGTIEQSPHVMRFLLEFADREAKVLLSAPDILRAELLGMAKEWRETGAPPPDLLEIRIRAPELYEDVEIVATTASPLEREVERTTVDAGDVKGPLLKWGTAIVATIAGLWFLGR